MTGGLGGMTKGLGIEMAGERGVVVDVLQDGIEVYWPGATSAAGVRSIIEWPQMAGIEVLTFAQCEGMASRL